MIVLVVLFVVLWTIPIFILVRNNKVHDFRGRVNGLCYEWAVQNIEKLSQEDETSAYEWFWGQLPSYDAMVYSIRPLTYKEWFSEEAEKIQDGFVNYIFSRLNKV